MFCLFTGLKYVEQREGAEDATERREGEGRWKEKNAGMKLAELWDHE